jgi:uncharacterized membrane protein
MTGFVFIVAALFGCFWVAENVNPLLGVLLAFVAGQMRQALHHIMSRDAE